MRLTGVARPKIDRRSFPKISRNSHVSVRAHPPKFERLRRRFAGLAEGVDNRVIHQYFRTIRVQDPFDTRRMLSEPGVNPAYPGDMLLNLSLYAASDSVNIFFMRKVLHDDDDFRTARRRAGVFSRFDLGDGDLVG